MDTAVPENTHVAPWRCAILLGLTAIVLLLTVYCLRNDIQTVFTHMYYVPIILAAYWYQKRGVLYSAGMGMVYLACVIFFYRIQSE